MHPGLKLGFALAPIRRRAPHAQEYILRHVFGLGRIAEHPPCEASDFHGMTAHERLRGAAIAGAGLANQFCVGIVHAKGSSRNLLQTPA